MKIDPSRYDTKVDRSVAEGPTDISSRVESFALAKRFGIDDHDSVERTTRLTVKSTIDFPEKYKGYYLLAEIAGLEEVVLWDDIDPDNRCIGNLEWFENDTFYMTAHVSEEMAREMESIYKHYSSVSNVTLFFSATAVGMESLEFEKDELDKGLAVTCVGCGVRPNDF